MHPHCPLAKLNGINTRDISRTFFAYNYEICLSPMGARLITQVKISAFGALNQ